MKKRILLFALLTLLFTSSSIAQSVRSKVLLYDDFYDNSGGWPLTDRQNEYSTIDKGYLTINCKHSGRFANISKPVPRLTEGNNFTIETKVQHISGSKNTAYGLLFGKRDNNFFEFVISSNGHYRIARQTSNNESIQDWVKSNFLHKGKFVSNTLKVVRSGYSWVFSINGYQVYKTTPQKLYGTEVGVKVAGKQKVSVDYVSVKMQTYNTTQVQAFPKQERYNEAPVIEILEPTSSRGFKALSRQFVHVKGKVTDNNGIASITVNNQAVAVGVAGFFVKDIPLTSGVNTIVVLATDKLGKVSQKIFEVNNGSSKIVDTNTSERRLALIIGNSSYENAGLLPNPVNDARDMSRKLKELGFEVLIYQDCSQKQVKRAMDEFGEKLNGFDVGLFFYAGHGVQVDGRNYLVPIDAELKTKNDVVYDCVDAARVLAKMEASKVKTNIIILDACRDNPFERSWSRKAKGSGLAFMNAPAGSFVAYSTSPGNTASDGNGRNGLYTAALLEHIGVSEIAIEDVFKRVRKSVKEKSEGKQIPWESTSLEGKFVFKQ